MDAHLVKDTAAWYKIIDARFCNVAWNARCIVHWGLEGCRHILWRKIGKRSTETGVRMTGPFWFFLCMTAAESSENVRCRIEMYTLEFRWFRAWKSVCMSHIVFFTATAKVQGINHWRTHRNNSFKCPGRIKHVVRMHCQTSSYSHCQTFLHIIRTLTLWAEPKFDLSYHTIPSSSSRSLIAHGGPVHCGTTSSTKYWACTEHCIPLLS